MSPISRVDSSKLVHRDAYFLKQLSGFKIKQEPVMGYTIDKDGRKGLVSLKIKNLSTHEDSFGYCTVIPRKKHVILPKPVLEEYSRYNEYEDDDPSVSKKVSEVVSFKDIMGTTTWLQSLTEVQIISLFHHYSRHFNDIIILL